MIRKFADFFTMSLYAAPISGRYIKIRELFIPFVILILITIMFLLFLDMDFMSHLLMFAVLPVIIAACLYFFSKHREKTTGRNIFIFSNLNDAVSMVVPMPLYCLWLSDIFFGGWSSHTTPLNPIFLIVLSICLYLVAVSFNYSRLENATIGDAFLAFALKFFVQLSVAAVVGILIAIAVVGREKKEDETELEHRIKDAATRAAAVGGAVVAVNTYENFVDRSIRHNVWLSMKDYLTFQTPVVSNEVEVEPS